MESPFDYIKSINKKTPIDNIDGYEPYLTNHALSAYSDIVLFANEMNLHPDLPKQMQYDFYYQIVRKGNRFEPWLKKNKNETQNNIELISNYYQFSPAKAKAALAILRDDQLAFIRQKMDKGG